MDDLEHTDEKRPFVLGVTGGIGSGKSTVCHIMETFGIAVFYADDVARRIMQSHSEVIAEVIREFGDLSYDDQGMLNRSHLADIVFSDDDKLKLLNGIVHPRVRKSFEDFIDDHRGNKLVVHESAIIYESGMDDMFDAVVVVDANVNRRLEWARKGGTSEEEFKRRMSRQMPADELARLADYIIYNNGDLDDLEDEVELLLTSLLFETKRNG